jgi:hypothetical protein
LNLVIGRLTVPNIESRCNQLKLGHPLEGFLELLTPGQTSYGQLVRFKQPRNALESNRIALKREMR